MADYLKTEALKDIADAFESTTKVLVNHSKRLDLVERNIDDLYDIASRSLKVASKATKKKQSLVVPVLIGVGIGLYLSRDKRNWDFKVYGPNMKAQRNPAADKQPANAQPKSEPTENGENPDA